MAEWALQGRLLALDANERRLRGVAAIAQRQGVPDGFLRVLAADLRAFAHEQASTSGRVGQQQGTAYDRVLLDVPCSGLGVLSKRADLRWRRSPANVAAISALQVGHLVVQESRASRSPLFRLSLCPCEDGPANAQYVSFCRMSCCMQPLCL